jgi:hypothetical protein
MLINLLEFAFWALWVTVVLRNILSKDPKIHEYESESDNSGTCIEEHLTKLRLDDDSPQKVDIPCLNPSQSSQPRVNGIQHLCAWS